MTDFYSVLQRAVGSLPDGSGPQRRAVYDKARKALLKQLQSFDPPLPSSDVTAQRLALEDAIRKIENEIARQIRTRRAVQGAASLTPARGAGGAGGAAPAAAGLRESEAEREARRRAEAARSRAQRAELLESAVSEATLQPAATTEPPASAPSRAGMPVPVAALPVPVAHEDIAPDDGGDAQMFEADAEPVPALPAGRRGRRGEPSFEERDVFVDDGDEGEDDVVDLDQADDTGDDRDAPDERADETGGDYDYDGADDHDNEEDDGHDEERAALARHGRRRRGRREEARRLQADKRGAGAPGQARRRRERGRSPLARIALSLVVLALLVGATYAAISQRERLMDVLAAFQPSNTESGAPGVRPAVPAAPPTPLKNDDRLSSSTVEGEETRAVTTTTVRTDASQAPDAAPAGASRDVTPFADDPGKTAAERQLAAIPRTGDLEAAAPAATGNAGPQVAVLYEEAAETGQQGSAASGTVEWSMVRQSVGGGEPEPVVRARAQIAERDVEVVLTIRENREGGLPASHLIEIDFEVPDTFAGGSIKNVPGLIMKESEEARGDPLRGATARVSDNLFWVALSDEEGDRAENLRLLRDRDWIDIPILYESGRRAILTLRKGSDGFQSVQNAIRAWSSG